MLFQRREPAGFRSRIRQMIWPRKGLRRSVAYYRLRVLRLAASPRAVAAGMAAGVFAAWTPFFGLHIVIALAVAFVLRGNFLAAALGTMLANPLTFPFIWAASWEMGHVLLSRDPASIARTIDLAEIFSFKGFAQLWRPVLEPMAVGSVPLGLVTAALIYPLTYFAVRGFQGRRRSRLRLDARAMDQAPE